MDVNLLVIEDETAIRDNLVMLLRMEGFAVHAAGNGEEGIQFARKIQPALILCDVTMPVRDGYQVLSALREDEATCAIPFIFLTALDDRDHFRRAMALGADDYITKPFTREDVLEAVKMRLDRVAATRRADLLATATHPSHPFRKPLAAFEDNGIDAQAAGQLHEAAILVADIAGLTQCAQLRSPEDISAFFGNFLDVVCAPIRAEGGRTLKIVGDTVVAWFATAADGTEHAARRGIRAALGMSIALQEFVGSFGEPMQGEGRHIVRMAASLHCGEMHLCEIGMGGQSGLTAVGETVLLATQLQRAAGQLGWTLLTSLRALHAAGEGVRFGQIETVSLDASSAPVDVVQVTGIDLASPPGGVLWAPACQAPQVPSTSRSDVGASNALDITQKLSPLLVRAHATDEGPEIKGFHLIRQIGKGGMSEVYLARREADGQELALKILHNRIGEEAELLQRFIQEYLIISQIRHPNVVQIYDQAFSDELAYIAMEYLPCGDLRKRIAAGISVMDAIDIICQTASALGAIHSQGVVHRDLKPDNLMFREDGSIALVDFGIAKNKLQALAETRHGQMYGTPFYMSPEQVATGEVSTRSDFYGLGVLAFEMLTGRKPYLSDDIDEVMRMHLAATIPSLPSALAHLQPLIERLMAKAPADRFDTADQIVDFVRTLKSTPSRTGLA